MIARDRIYIDGSWVPSSGTGTIDVINSATEEVMGTVPDGVPEDVDRAVAAARAAFEGWSQTSPEERGKYLTRIAEALQARMQEIGELISSEVGMPARLSGMIQVGLPTRSFQEMGELAASYPYEEQDGGTILRHTPVGVVGAITPWNYPLHQIAAKVAPALAAGCTVVLKPSEVAPLNAFVLAEIMEEVGLPAGVFNLVCGTGPVVGEAIAAHSDVDMVSFTGSTRGGKRVSELAAQTVKRVTLELGGKSPNVLLDDLDDETLEKAVKAGVSACYLNSGQTCSALTRMIVPRSKLSDVERIAAEAAESFKIGDPHAPETRLGPLASETQRERVLGYIKKGLEEGAKLVVGGTERPEGLEKGYFVKPTVFSEVRNESTIAQEEIFGPVLAIIPYETEEDAVRIANDTVYGLSGGVWSSDTERAKKVASRIRTGQVSINGGRGMAPFGGFKQSGHGRELGKWGLEEYLEIQALQT